MSRQRSLILFSLAILTCLFLGAAAVTFYGNPFSGQGEQPIHTLPIGEAPQAVRLTILEDGIAAIHARDLRRTNLPFQDFSVDELRLTKNGEDVPMHFSGNGDNATMYFYAEAVTNTLEAPAVYWLSPGAGVPMRQRDATPLSPAGTTSGWQYRVWEENSTFLAQANGQDNWLGPLLYAPAQLDIELDNIVTNGGPGELTIQVWSNNESAQNPDHHIEVFLNGEKLSDHYWDGIRQQTITLSLVPGKLQSGMNLLTLNVPGDTGAAGEAIYLDWVSLGYKRELDTDRGEFRFASDADNIGVNILGEDILVFDVTNPQSPTALLNFTIDDGTATFSGGDGLTTHSYLLIEKGNVPEPRVDLVPEWQALKSSENGADYIMIVPDVEGFDGALQPLIEHRRGQGLRVMSVSLDQVFDEFAYGRRMPEAIRDFLRYATEEWEKPAPKYVLLVGDATYDLYDYTGGSNKNLLPTQLYYTEFAGLVASDTWFTIFDEEQSPPSLAIGRFPAQNLEQLRAIVSKTIAYELTSSEERDWIDRALLVSDDEPRFDEASELLNQSLESTGYRTQKLYMTENEDIHDAIISAMNHGVGILNYVGHGGVEVWGDEIVLQASDARILENGNRLPIFTTFTCLNGYFNHPTADALAETLLWAENGGVVAAIAPSGRSFTSQQKPLADAFYNYLLQGHVATLGEALLLAKNDAFSDPDLLEVIHTFNLLGDPALHFILPGLSASG